MPDFINRPITQVAAGSPVVDSIAVNNVPLASVDNGTIFRFTISTQYKAILDQIGDINSVWIDATGATADVLVRNVTTQQFARWPPGSSGWQIIVFKKPAEIVIESADAATLNVTLSSSAIQSDMIFAGNSNARVGTYSRVAASTVSVTLCAANPRRKGLTIYNDSTAILNILPANAGGGVPTYSFQLYPSGTYEMEVPYTGIVTGVWSTATGGASVTEYT